MSSHVQALLFIKALHKNFEATRQRLLNARHQRQKRIDSGTVRAKRRWLMSIAGEFPTFLEKTKKIREVRFRFSNTSRDTAHQTCTTPLLDARIDPHLAFLPV